MISLAGRHTFVFLLWFFEPGLRAGGSNHPAAGTLEMAAKPFGTSRSRSEASIRKNPSEFLFVSEEEKSHSLYIIRDPRDFSATAPNYLRFEHPCCIFFSSVKPWMFLSTMPFSSSVTFLSLFTLTVTFPHFSLAERNPHLELTSKLLEFGTQNCLNQCMEHNPYRPALIRRSRLFSDPHLPEIGNTPYTKSG